MLAPVILRWNARAGTSFCPRWGVARLLAPDLGRWGGTGYARLRGEHSSPAAHSRREAGFSFHRDVVSSFTRILLQLPEKICVSEAAGPLPPKPMPMAVVGAGPGGASI